MEQSRIHQSDQSQAIHTLTELVKTDKNWQRSMAIAQQIVFADKVLNPEEEAVWTQISKALKLKSQLR